jgi:hypothetical protein
MCHRQLAIGRGRKVKTCKLMLCFVILALTLMASSRTIPVQSAKKTADENIWYVHDIINPSLNEVKWSEEGP